MAPRLSPRPTELGLTNVCKLLNALPNWRRDGVWAVVFMARHAGPARLRLFSHDMVNVPVLGLADWPLGVDLFFDETLHRKIR